MPIKTPTTPSEGVPAVDTTSTVLLTDDDDQLRELLRLWLEADGGWVVREADSGTDALEKLDESVDILTLDREMPGCSGADVVSRLRHTAVDCAVVIHSGLQPDDSLNEEMVDAYLVKPTTREAFLRTLTACR